MPLGTDFLPTPQPSGACGKQARVGVAAGAVSRGQASVGVMGRRGTGGEEEQPRTPAWPRAGARGNKGLQGRVRAFRRRPGLGMQVLVTWSQWESMQFCFSSASEWAPLFCGSKIAAERQSCFMLSSLLVLLIFETHFPCFPVRGLQPFARSTSLCEGRC